MIGLLDKIGLVVCLEQVVVEKMESGRPEETGAEKGLVQCTSLLVFSAVWTTNDDPNPGLYLQGHHC